MGELGDYELQKVLLTQALEIYEKYFGIGHPLTIRVQTILTQLPEILS